MRQLNAAQNSHLFLCIDSLRRRSRSAIESIEGPMRDLHNWWIRKSLSSPLRSSERRREQHREMSENACTTHKSRLLSDRVLSMLKRKTLGDSCDQRRESMMIRF